MYLLGYNMSIAAAVGFIALAGVAVEIGVLMLVYLNQALEEAIRDARESGRGLTARELMDAVIDGAALRVRPIMMTVLTVVVGLVPIMLSDGTGSEVMQRISGPMVGGMISTLILTLLVIPVIFFVWKRTTLNK